VKHETKFNYGGTNENAWMQPACSCGWDGRKHYAHEDYQNQNARFERSRHEHESRAIAAQPPAQKDLP
jgi:hypothetical protein